MKQRVATQVTVSERAWRCAAGAASTSVELALLDILKRMMVEVRKVDHLQATKMLGRAATAIMQSTAHESSTRLVSVPVRARESHTSHYFKVLSTQELVPRVCVSHSLAM